MLLSGAGHIGHYIQVYLEQRFDAKSQSCHWNHLTLKAVLNRWSREAFLHQRT